MATAEDLKKENLKKIRTCLYTGDSWSLAQLKQRTSLSHGFIVSALKELSDSGEIVLKEKTGSTVGRKTYRYGLNPDCMHLCGILVMQNENSYTYRIAELDLAGRVTDSLEKEVPVFSEDSFREIAVPFMKQRRRIRWAAVCCPGICANGIAVNPGRYTVRVQEVIRQDLSLPCVIENDVNVASIGFAKDFPGTSHLALIYQASRERFGCGVIVHGRLYNGHSHAAGELRWLPFMKQRETKSAEELLSDQICSVAAVLDPDIIGWYSNVLPPETPVSELPMPEANRPCIIAVRDMHALILKGIHSIGIDRIIQTGGIV